MNNTTDTAANNNYNLLLTEISPSAWERFSGAFIGSCTNAKCKLPLVMTRLEYVQALPHKVTDKDLEGAGLDAHHEREKSVRAYLQDQYSQMNDKVHGRLTIAVRDLEQARNILAKYDAGRGPDPSDPYEVMEDPSVPLMYGAGRAAWLEIKQACLGGKGLDTADGILSRMYDLEHQQHTISTFLSKHTAEVKKLKDIPNLTVDQIVKQNLLHGMRTLYPEYQVTEERCSNDEEIDYNQTAVLLLRAATRMNSRGATACYSKTEPCWRCGQPGHMQRDCKVVIGDSSSVSRRQGSHGRGGSRAGHGSGQNQRNDQSTSGEGKSKRKSGRGSNSGKSGRRKNVRGTSARLAAAEEALRAAGIEIDDDRDDEDVSSSELDEEEEYGFTARTEGPTSESAIWMEAYHMIWTIILIAFMYGMYHYTIPKATAAIGTMAKISGLRYGPFHAAVGMIAKISGMRYGQGKTIDCDTQESASVASAGSARITINVDTGCTRHMFGRREVFDPGTYKQIQGRVKLADQATTHAIGEGTVKFKALDNQGEIRMITLENCWHVPACGDNHLFSISQMRKSRFEGSREAPVAMFASALLLRFNENCTCPFREDNDGSYRWDVETLPVKTEQASVGQGLPLAKRPPCAVDNRRHRKQVDQATWHDRFGHISPSTLAKMGDTTVKGLQITKGKELGHKDQCPVCLQANLKKTPRSLRHGIKTSQPLELVHVDNVEGFKVKSFGKSQGYLFVDDYSRHKWFGATNSKRNFLDILQEYCTFVKTKSRRVTEVSIQSLRTDWATELSAGKTKKWCDENGIKLTHSSPGVHQENGIVERAIGTVKEVARAMHKGAGWPPEFWLMSMKAACHVMQFWPQTIHGGKTAYEMLYGNLPDVSHLRTLGCLVYFHNWYEGKINFHADRGLKGILVGYVDESRAYLIYRPETQRLIKSSEVVFEESVKPMALKVSQEMLNRIKVPAITWGQDSEDDLHQIQLPSGVKMETKQSENNQPKAIPEAMKPSYVSIEPMPMLPAPAESQAQEATPPQESSRPRREAAEDASERIRAGYEEGSNRAEAAYLKPKNFEAMCQALVANETQGLQELENYVQEHARSAVSGFYGYEPFSHRDAMTCTDADKWQEAEAKEIQGLERLGAFEYVDEGEPKRVGKKLISCKWVYKIKPEKYKARLVIRGFMQEESGETYAPTMRLVSFRLLLAISTLLSWTTLQQDVVNAFLNATLTIPVYMKCIEGWEQPGKCIKLKKALYGLKDSPRAWFDTLKDRLLEIGMIQTVMDPCMFVLIEDQRVVMLVGIHVDDCLCIGQDPKVKWFAGMMTRVFMMEDLGRPERMLGMDIEWTEKGVVIRQTTYINKVLKRFGMETCHGSPTPMTPGTRLLKSQQADEKDEKPEFEYRSCVACLIYLAVCTRFELCFAVKELSTYLERPGKTMITQAKRAMRYLQTTKNHGIRYANTLKTIPGTIYKSTMESMLSAWSDSDWASQPEDRKSTEGCIVMFNGTALLWWSKTIKTICLSSTAAEYIAASDTCREVVFLRSLLEAIGFRCERATPYFCDNQGAITTASGVNTTKSKHIECRYHFIRQKQEQNEVDGKWIKTTDQCADVMTKALNGPQHYELTIRASGYPELTKKPDEGFDGTTCREECANLSCGEYTLTEYANRAVAIETERTPGVIRTLMKGAVIVVLTIISACSLIRALLEVLREEIQYAGGTRGVRTKAERPIPKRKRRPKMRKARATSNSEQLLLVNNHFPEKEIGSDSGQFLLANGSSAKAIGSPDNPQDERDDDAAERNANRNRNNESDTIDRDREPGTTTREGQEHLATRYGRGDASPCSPAMERDSAVDRRLRRGEGSGLRHPRGPEANHESVHTQGAGHAHGDPPDTTRDRGGQRVHAEPPRGDATGLRRQEDLRSTHKVSRRHGGAAGEPVRQSERLAGGRERSTETATGTANQ